MSGFLTPSAHLLAVPDASDSASSWRISDPWPSSLRSTSVVPPDACLDRVAPYRFSIKFRPDYRMMYNEHVNEETRASYFQINKTLAS